MKAKNAKEALDEEEGETETKTMLVKTNSSQMGGKIIEATDTQTIIPVVLMRERVTNGALKKYEEFAPHAHWFEGVPIIGPHKQGDPPVSHTTSKAGKLRNVRLNSELKRVEAEAILFNDRIAPGDLERIKNGEPFGGSIGYYCNDEILSSPQKWEDGTEYTRIEKGPFFADHFSMVPNGACPLPECGFNVNNQVDNMTDETKIEVAPTKAVEAPKTNAVQVTPEPPTVNVAVDLSTVLTEMKSLGTQIAEIKTNMANKDAEIASLRAAEEVRINAQRATEDKLIAETVERMLLPAFKGEKDAHIAAFKANSALWIAQNTDKIDFAAYAKSVKIEPSSTAFVPHVNADDEEAGYAAVGVP